jgi:hypothetical protein
MNDARALVTHLQRVAAAALVVMASLEAHANSSAGVADPLRAHEREVQPRSLCARDERVVFNCLTGNKIASVCGVRANAGAQLVQYRYGRPGAVEISLPTKVDDTGRDVAFQEAFSASGHAAYLRFTAGRNVYYVYDASESAGNNLVTGASTRVEPAGIAVRTDGAWARRLNCTRGPERMSRLADPGLPLAVTRTKAGDGVDPFAIAFP